MLLTTSSFEELTQKHAVELAAARGETKGLRDLLARFVSESRCEDDL